MNTQSCKLSLIVTAERICKLTHTLNSPRDAAEGDCYSREDSKWMRQRAGIWQEPRNYLMSKTDFVRDHPDFPWLGLENWATLETLLRQRGWLADDELLRECEKPGDGNMNLTIRVRTDRRSMIVKQARPWVEKYDHIPAPWDRVQYEARFYERVAWIPAVADRMPRLLGFDHEARVLVLEDLSDAVSLATLYAGGQLAAAELRQLGEYLRSLHGETLGPADPNFANRKMRRLNHQHIFELPLAENNGIDLDRFEVGLAPAARRLRQDADYYARVRELGDCYLSNGNVLIHGDFFPGSWLRTAKGVFVIDPEFCFYGDAAFDLGCAIAHLCLAQQPLVFATTLLQTYAEGSSRVEPEIRRVACFAAVETMRRLIGVAQLPLAAEVKRVDLLERSRRAMIHQSWEELWA